MCCGFVLSGELAMSEMVERVARAMCKARRRDPDRCRPEGQPQWMKYRREARAAIEAMRKPTDEMLDTLSTGETWDRYLMMIDAALKD